MDGRRVDASAQFAPADRYAHLRRAAPVHQGTQHRRTMAAFVLSPGGLGLAKPLGASGALHPISLPASP